MKYNNFKDGLRELPKVGFHLWQIFFLGLLRLRGCKGRLLIVWQSSRLPEGFICPFVPSMVQRWASSLRRWAFIVFGPKVGFHLWPKVGLYNLVGCKGDLPGFQASSFEALKYCQNWQNCQRWALFGQRWAPWCQRWAYLLLWWASYSLAGFEASRRLYLSFCAFHGAKVGFQSWKMFFAAFRILPKVGLFAPLVGLNLRGFKDSFSLSEVLPKVDFSKVVLFNTFLGLETYLYIFYTSLPGLRIFRSWLLGWLLSFLYVITIFQD